MPEVTICTKCGERYSNKRKLAGYFTCMDCGDIAAQKQITKRSKQIAPLFNKGGYQLITAVDDLSALGTKGKR